MTRAIIGAHSCLLATGLTVNLVRLFTGSLRWPATLYTGITAACLVAALVSLSLPIRPAALTYSAVGTVGILIMAGMSPSFPWLLALLPSGVLAVGGALGVKAAGVYAGLSAAISAVTAIAFRDPGGGLALIGMSGMALVSILLVHRQALDNVRLKQKLEEEEKELGDVVYAIEIFASGRRQ